MIKQFSDKLPSSTMSYSLQVCVWGGGVGSIVSSRVSQCPQINMIFYLVIVLPQSPRSRHMFIRKVCAVYKAGLFSLLGFKGEG